MIFLLVFLSSTSPFWHIKFEPGVKNGVFGFSSLRSFFYTFGTHFILFGASVFFMWILHLIPNVDELTKKVKKIGYIGVLIYCSVSIYYLLYVFIDTSNSPYPDSYYEFTFILLSMIGAGLTYKVFRLFEYVKTQRAIKEKDTEEFINSSLELMDELKKGLN